MAFMARLSHPSDPENKDPEHPENIVQFAKSDDSRALVADEDDIETLGGRPTEEVEHEATDVFNKLDQSVRVTDV